MANTPRWTQYSPDVLNMSNTPVDIDRWEDALRRLRKEPDVVAPKDFNFGIRSRRDRVKRALSLIRYVRRAGLLRQEPWRFADA